MLNSPRWPASILRALQAPDLKVPRADHYSWGRYRNSSNPPWEPYRDATIEEILNRPNVRFDTKGKQALEAAHGYFSCVTGIDDQFGRILDALKQAGLEEDTIIVFTSDHGEMMGSHDEMGKPHFYEEAFGVPFMISWAGILAPRHEELLLGTPDIMPTLLGLMGLGDKVPGTVEGTNYQAAIHNLPNAQRPEMAWYYCAFNGRGARTKDQCCYFVRRDGQPSENLLFDLRNDPYQVHNRSAEDPATVREFGAATKSLMQSLNDPFKDYVTDTQHIDSIQG